MHDHNCRTVWEAWHYWEGYVYSYFWEIRTVSWYKDMNIFTSWEVSTKIKYHRRSRMPSETGCAAPKWWELKERHVNPPLKKIYLCVCVFGWTCPGARGHTGHKNPLLVHFLNYQIIFPALQCRCLTLPQGWPRRPTDDDGHNIRSSHILI